MAVVKSDAYGHGMKEVAETLAPYVSSFGVVFMEEALQLRAHGISSPSWSSPPPRLAKNVC